MSTFPQFLDALLVRFFSLSNKIHTRLAKFVIRKGLAKAMVEIPLDLRALGAQRPEPYHCSFRVEILSHRKSWWGDQAGRMHPEWALDNKLDAYRFMSAIGVRTPDILFSGMRCDEAEIVPNSVLKPESGYQSSGVFVIDPHGVAREVTVGTEYRTPEALRARMRELLAKGRVEKDIWYAESRIGSDSRKTAPDIKFYSFYGEVPLVLRVDRDGAEPRYETLDRSGKPMPSGKYKEQPLPHIVVTDAMFAEAERISLLIPSPFLRLDFLLGDGLVFGEIGNMVGGYTAWSNTWDRRLGDAFARARGRLYEDLRSNKSFAEYDRFLNESSRRASLP